MFTKWNEKPLWKKIVWFAVFEIVQIFLLWQCFLFIEELRCPHTPEAYFGTYVAEENDATLILDKDGIRYNSPQWFFSGPQLKRFSKSVYGLQDIYDDDENYGIMIVFRSAAEIDFYYDGQLYNTLHKTESE